MVERIEAKKEDDVLHNGDIQIELRHNPISDGTFYFSNKSKDSNEKSERKVSASVEKNHTQTFKRKISRNKTRESILFKESKGFKLDKFMRILHSKLKIMNKAFSQCTYLVNKSFKRIKENHLPDLKSQKKQAITKKNTNMPKPKIQKLQPNDINIKYLLNIIMGIEMTLGATPNINIIESQDISKYMKSLKYPVATATLHGTDDIYYIVDHAGILFNNIRKAYGIQKEEFIHSISPKDFVTEMMISYTTNIEELVSTSKSGSMFYYTRDGKYILKTIPKKEYKFLKKMLGDYFFHVTKNKNTLLPKIYGCYKLIRQIKDVKLDKIYFIVMENLFRTNKEIKVRYDLKGSTYGRRVIQPGDEAKFNGKTVDFALLDCDLETNKQSFHLGVDS